MPIWSRSDPVFSRIRKTPGNDRVPVGWRTGSEREAACGSRWRKASNKCSVKSYNAPFLVMFFKVRWYGDPLVVPGRVFKPILVLNVVRGTCSRWELNGGELIQRQCGDHGHTRETLVRNPHKQSRKQLEIHLQACRRRFRQFGVISGAYQNPPCSKPWAIALAFCSKSANFGPCKITWNPHEQSRKQLEIHLHACRSCFREFGAFSSTYQNSPCSKPWAIAQAFCSKSANFGPCKFTRNPHKQSCKQLEIHLEACRRHFWEFGAISGTYENPPCSKPWAIAQAFCSKSTNFGPLWIHLKSTQTIP